MQKCDVVIPVYKSPEWVELCLYALFRNTRSDVLNKVYLINDSDDVFTKNSLRNLKAKYDDKIVIKQNKKNLGFTGTANIGLRLVEAEYALLLNTDCLVARGTIEKLMHHMSSDEKIGLICPISSNAANLSLDILEGFTYTQMDELLEKRFKGKLFDACTVVGNCLMISKKCIDEVGLLDEIYAPGYGEETDYQFAAMEKGFSAKVAIDTYVFHKAETSFGVSEKKQKMIEEHLSIFFSRWGEEYEREMKKYEKNDPIRYILADFKNNPPKIENEAMFYMLGLGMSGGCNVVVDIINRLAINGCQCNIIYDEDFNYLEPMLFKPVSSKKIDEISTKKLVATLWVTAFLAKKIAIRKKWELVYFVQGLEQHFEDGRNYGAVETSYKVADRIVVVSQPLKEWIKNICGIDSDLIRNGVNIELLKNQFNHGKPRTILLIARNDYRKCNYVLFDILRRIDVSMSGVKVNVVLPDDGIIPPVLSNKKNKYDVINGPLERIKVFELMQESDIYVDTSYSEGFGLTALEAMAAGCIPIVSDSIGVRDYIKDSTNGIIIKSINDADEYLRKIQLLMDKSEVRRTINDGMQKTIEKYDFNSRIENYKRLFCKYDKKTKSRENVLTEEEKAISKKIVSVFDKEEKEKRRLELEEREWRRKDMEWRKNLTIPQRIYLKIRYILIGR